MNGPERQAFLDGFRHGLGSAVRRIEYLCANLPEKIADDEAPMVRTVLVGLARGLQIISASVVLADDDGAVDG